MNERVIAVLSTPGEVGVSLRLRSPAGARAGSAGEDRVSMTTRDDARRGAATTRPDGLRLGSGRG